MGEKRAELECIEVRKFTVRLLSQRKYMMEQIGGDYGMVCINIELKVDC